MENGSTIHRFASRGVRRGSLLFLTFGFAPLFLSAPSASAQNTITVTTKNDTGGSWSGTAPSISCTTLRAAIYRANQDSGDTIDFASTAYGTITLTQQETSILRSMTIQGPGANVLSVTGGGSYQIFNITAANVTISGLTLANGNAGSNNGGAIYYDDNSRLNVYSCSFTGNSGQSGGAIDDDGGGVLTVTNSTFFDNEATFLDGGAIQVAGPPPAPSR